MALAIVVVVAAFLPWATDLERNAEVEDEPFEINVSVGIGLVLTTIAGVAIAIVGAAGYWPAAGPWEPRPQAIPTPENEPPPEEPESTVNQP
jgi:hypothetical protein